jgi:hypothetical protein
VVRGLWGVGGGKSGDGGLMKSLGEALRARWLVLGIVKLSAR